jgi:hypothetical protein
MDFSFSGMYGTRSEALERLDTTAVIVSFAAFFFGSFMIVGAIALWGFHSLAGWPGVAVALIASTALTVAFRDRMRTTVQDEVADHVRATIGGEVVH